MKKLLAILLATSFTFSLVACGNSATNKNSKTGAETLNNQASKSDKTDSNDFLGDINSFDDFVEKMDDNGYKPVIEENDDGSVTVELVTPSTDDENKPVIPTIDKITTPTPTPTPEPTPEPTPAPTPTPTPKPEETKDPEPEPEPEPEPTKPEKDDKIEEDPTPEPEETNPDNKVLEPTIKEETEKKPTYTYTTNQKHTKVPYTERYLYSILDDEKKTWYRSIDKTVTNLESRAVIKANLATDRNYYIYFLYMFDNPEHFYLGASVTIYSYGENSDDLLLSYSDGEMSCRFGGELKEINDELRARIKAKKAVFENEVERIISTIPSNAPDVWKERLIYDRILTDSYYNLSAQWDGIANDNWTAYGILVNKYGVCESYSEAFQTLCLYAGINCTGVVGTAGGGHKWNCVELDGEWYMCDITFDDPIGGGAGAAYHTYFNITSELMKEYNHDWSNSEWPVPNCTATKYSYRNYFAN